MKEILFTSLLLIANLCVAGEVSSPEAFMRENYGWTISNIDSELGVFGNFKQFKCYDDKLSPPRTEEENLKKRWATQCLTKRYPGENLGAMMFVTWVNPKHAKPITTSQFQQDIANGMANQKENNSEPRCEKQLLPQPDKKIDLYDCAMVLPFGTYFASFLHFEHRGIEFYVRAANASNTPDSRSPKDKIREILKALSFSQDAQPIVPRDAQQAARPLPQTTRASYKGFPIFVKQKSTVVESRSD
jgi:hypothetical protein